MNARLRLASPKRSARRRGEGGFTLIELLVAAALGVVVFSAVAALVTPMRRTFDRGLSGGELTSRGRAALSIVAADVRNAGSGIVIGPTSITLGDVIPVVTVVPPSTIALTRARGPQGLLRQHVNAGEMSLRLDTSEPCTEQDATCGIRARDAIAIFDADKGEIVVVSTVATASAMVHLSAPLAHAFDAGAVIAAIEETTFTLRDGRLVRITAGGAEQPIADHALAFDAALLARRVDLGLVVEPASRAGIPLALRTSVGLRK
jgi:prepilin-type N-terminal cleavage/methylation domain-containing protein